MSTENNVKYIVSFVISDFEQEPEEITKILNIEPSSTWKTGDSIHPKASIKRKSNGWLLKYKLINTNNENNDEEYLENCFGSMMKMLHPSWTALKMLSNNGCDIQFSIVINIYEDDRPAIHFSPEIIKSASEINASIDIDLYVLNN